MLASYLKHQWIGNDNEDGNMQDLIRFVESSHDILENSKIDGNNEEKSHQAKERFLVVSETKNVVGLYLAKLKRNMDTVSSVLDVKVIDPVANRTRSRKRIKSEGQKDSLMDVLYPEITHRTGKTCNVCALSIEPTDKVITCTQKKCDRPCAHLDCAGLSQRKHKWMCLECDTQTS